MRLSSDVHEYLKRCGLPKRLLDRCTGATRLYHDLGVYGDVAEAYMEALVDEYQVDLNGFDFDAFFPAEFVGKNSMTRTFLWLVPFARGAARRRESYAPLTLETIDRLIHVKQWRAVAKRDARN